MPTIWIVHREPHIRTALARLAGVVDNAIVGSPLDPHFASAEPPEAIVLGVSGDLEAELEFANRVARRVPGARWILVSERRHLEAARRLFDSIDAEVLAYPPEARVLRVRLRAARGPRVGSTLPLSQRAPRNALSERFARWLADLLERPELLRSLDPRLGDVPVLIRGETGTGRALLARYLHAFGPGSDRPFARLSCDVELSPHDLRAALRAAAGDAGPGMTVCLEEVDRLPRAAQRELQQWVELAPPGHVAPGPVERWIATAGDETDAEETALEPRLRDALCGIIVRIPPLRERPQAIARFANETALAWSEAHREAPPRRFGEDALSVLEEYPWPGNLRELEAVVLETLAAGAENPVRADDLRYDGAAFAPLEVAEVGVRLSDEAEPEPPPEPAGVPLTEAEVEAAASAPPQPAAPTGELEAMALPENGAEAGPDLQHLFGAVAHEMRNPLSTIRTFAELLPERFEDPDFRARFSELVIEDVRRLEEVVQRLSGLASLARPDRDAVDVAGLLQEILQERRERAHSRRLLVLTELDTEYPHAMGDAVQLRLALEALINQALGLTPEGGDVYIASKHHPSGLHGAPAIRVLVRFGGRRGAPRAPHVPGLSPAENSLEIAIAEAVVRSQGGIFSIDAGEGEETVVVMDLPA